MLVELTAVQLVARMVETMVAYSVDKLVRFLEHSTDGTLVVWMVVRKELMPVAWKVEMMVATKVGLMVVKKVDCSVVHLVRMWEIQLVQRTGQRLDSMMALTKDPLKESWKESKRVSQLAETMESE